jgi:hypothetical protein
LSPKPWSDSASTVNDTTFTLSSPRRVLMTSPVATIHVPRGRLLNVANSCVQSTPANSCSSPVQSRSSPKASFPLSRRSIRRPATVTVAPVSSPSAISAHWSRTARRLWVGWAR